MSEGGSPPQTTSKHDIFLTVDYHDDYSVIRRRDMRSGREELLAVRTCSRSNCVGDILPMSSSTPRLRAAT